jgi:hypothetical protein
LALRLRFRWWQAVREHDAMTLQSVRVGSPRLARVAVPPGLWGLALLEFEDGRMVRLRGVQRAAAQAVGDAARDSTVELIEGAHPGPVWALYFRVGAAGGRQLALLAQAAYVVPREGGLRSDGWAGAPPPRLARV